MKSLALPSFAPSLLLLCLAGCGRAHSPPEAPATGLPQPASEVELRRLEQRIAPRMARRSDLSVQTRADGSQALDLRGSYHHVNVAVTRLDGRVETMCLERPVVPRHVDAPLETY